MATKQDRGTKRTCQSTECGARFYDLNRNPITCPICGADYIIASSPTAIAAVQPEEKPARKVKKEEFAEADTTEADAEEEVLAEVETDDDDDVADGEDETFLEEDDEEGGDVTNIIGGARSEGDEET